ncbi:MAG: S-layer homology domain-containing protein [Oscillospiraceae bacterium]|nr:S-layer homology domain-containing protein [Oscillospiraceae bacterium]
MIRIKGKGALFRVLCVAGLCAFLMIPAAAQTFSDVPDDHWARDYIEEAANDGAIKGYANNTFEPDAPLSLAHFTVMMSRSFYKDDYNAELGWIDPNNAVGIEWYTPAEWVAREHGLLNGINIGMTQQMNRYQMARIIYNLLQSKGVEFSRTPVLNALNSIADLDKFPNDTMRNAVACVYSKGIMKGYEDGSFYGDTGSTRAEAATIYYRLKHFFTPSTSTTTPAQTTTPSTDYGTLPNKSPSKMTVRDVYTPSKTTGKTFTFQGAKIPIYEGVETLKVSAGEFVWRDGRRIRYTGNRYDAWFGVDVSAYQNKARSNGTINWKAAKADGVQFAMIRVGLRGTSTGALREDAYYAKNIEGALAQGIQTGAYIFAQAVNIKEAIEEADFVIERLRGHKINGPVSYDWEINDSSYRVANVSKEMATACAVAFCKRVAAAGYTPMFYNSRYVAYMKYDQGALAPYMMWYPQYPSTSTTRPYPNLYYQMDFWQFSESAVVYGIGDRIDSNIWFKPKK